MPSSPMALSLKNSYYNVGNPRLDKAIPLSPVSEMPSTHQPMTSKLLTNQAFKPVGLPDPPQPHLSLLSWLIAMRLCRRCLIDWEHSSGFASALPDPRLFAFLTLRRLRIVRSVVVHYYFDLPHFSQLSHLCLDNVLASSRDTFVSPLAGSLA